MKQANAMPEDPIRVLLVDGHDHVLWGLAKLIDGEWPRMMVVGRARDAVEAARLLTRYRPDVLVIDRCLATGNGADAAARAASVAGAGILMLDRANGDCATQAPARGATDDAVRKDAPAEKLLGEIERVHREHRGGRR